MREAIEWLSYTYLYVRMRLNNLGYGIDHETVKNDPNLENERMKLIHNAAMNLDKAQMIRYIKSTGDLNATGTSLHNFFLLFLT